MKVRFGFQFCREGRCRGEARRSCSLSFHSLHSLHSRCFPTESSRLKPLPQASDQPVGPQSSASASSPAPATILLLVKVGRASVREKVCQYVWNSVVAVTFK